MIDPISGTFLATTLLFSTPQTRIPRWLIEPSIAEAVLRDTEQTMFLDNYFEVMRPDVIYRPVTQVESDYRGKLLERLLGWRDLQEGWDGEQSEAPSHAAIDLAAELINALPQDVSLPKPMLSSSGEVGLYWDMSEKYVDVEFGADSHFSAYFRNKNTGEEQLVENLSLNEAGLNSFFAAIGSSYRMAA